MATVLVWSEKPEPNAPSLRDCTYSSGLMGMVHAGWKDFPKGIYSVAEREALERSDLQPNETGASLDDLVLALRNRYGVHVAKQRGVKAALAHVGSLLVVQGSNGNWPKGDRLRRWDPGFVGGHACAAVVEAVGRIRWLDPEATNKYTGDITTPEKVLQWTQGWGDNYIEFRSDQFAPVPTGADMPNLTSYTPGSTAAVKPKSNIRSAPTITTATLLRTTTTVSEPVVLTGTVKGAVDPANGSDVWYVWWKNGRWEYTAKDNIIDIKAPGTATPPPDTTPYSQKQYDDHYAEGVNAGLQKGFDAAAATLAENLVQVAKTLLTKQPTP